MPVAGAAKATGGPAACRGRSPRCHLSSPPSRVGRTSRRRPRRPRSSTVNGSPAPTVSGVPASQGLSDPPSSHVYEPSCPIAGSPPSAASVAAGGALAGVDDPPLAVDAGSPVDASVRGRGAGRGRRRPGRLGVRTWARRRARGSSGRPARARRCRRRRRSSRPPRWPATPAHRSSERQIASGSFLPGQMHGVSGPARRMPASHRLNTRTLTVGDVSPLMPSFDGVANTAR